MSDGTCLNCNCVECRCDEDPEPTDRCPDCGQEWCTCEREDPCSDENACPAEEPTSGVNVTSRSSK